MNDFEIDKYLQQELREKYNPDGSVLRKAQLRMLEMLKYLDKTCRENSIEYWLESGTLLGAVRHGGFIPWDDDVDIAMTRKDAKKLRKILIQQSSHPDFVYQCHETDPFHFVFWDRLRDTKSANVAPSYAQDHLIYKGLAIDIFRLDDNINDWLQQKCISLNHYLLTLPLSENTGIWTKLRPILPFLYRLMRHIVLPVAQVLSIFHKNDYLNYSYGQPWKRKYPKDAIYPLDEIQFEGYSFKAPADLNRYLYAAFTDWKQVPPENKRVTHNIQLETYFE